MMAKRRSCWNQRMQPALWRFYVRENERIKVADLRAVRRVRARAVRAAGGVVKVGLAAADVLALLHECVATLSPRCIPPFAGPERYYRRSGRASGADQCR